MEQSMNYPELPEQCTCLDCGWEGEEVECGGEHDEYTAKKITNKCCPKCGGDNIS